LRNVRHPPADNVLRAFPRARRVRGKTPFASGIRRRWRDPDGTIYEWDYQHGTVEVYDRRGFHLGEFDPETGAQLSPAISGRIVEP
jgi:hypothetical protein